MPALSEYSNVYDTAVTVLQKKGYQVWYDDQSELFCAELDGWDFQSDSPCGLLGLVAIYEFQSPSEYFDGWWKEANPADHRKLPSSPKEYLPVWRKQ